LIDNQIFGAFLAFTAACCWGSAGVLFKAVIKDEHSLFLSVAIRGMIAVPFLALLTLFVNGFENLSILFQPDIFPIVFFSSVFVSSGDLCFFAALQLIEVSKSQPVASIYPLFTIFLLIIFALETVSMFVILSTILLITGIGLVSQRNGDSSEESLLVNPRLKRGLLLSIGAAMFWSLAIITVDYLLEIPKVDVFVFSLATIRFGILTILISALWIIFDKYQLNAKEKGRVFAPFTRKEILVFGLNGILSWGVGAVSFFTAMELIGSARATPISSINPLVAVILGIIFLREKFSSLQAVGILLVCLASILISVA
jgi:DME family drug/metabolite transporter